MLRTGIITSYLSLRLLVRRGFLDSNQLAVQTVTTEKGNGNVSGSIRRSLTEIDDDCDRGFFLVLAQTKHMEQIVVA
jgi:hypothetical protein